MNIYKVYYDKDGNITLIEIVSYFRHYTKPGDAFPYLVINNAEFYLPDGLYVNSREHYYLIDIDFLILGFEFRIHSVQLLKKQLRNQRLKELL